MNAAKYLSSDHRLRLPRTESGRFSDINRDSVSCQGRDLRPLRDGHTPGTVDPCPSLRCGTAALRWSDPRSRQLAASSDEARTKRDRCCKAVMSTTAASSQTGCLPQCLQAARSSTCQRRRRPGSWLHREAAARCPLHPP